MSDKPSTHTEDPPRSFWQILKSIGPGLIISANIVGSGELIVTTKLGADVGFTLLWFILFSCLIKVFVQVELGRYAISEGKTTLQALNDLPGPRLIVSWIIWFWAIMYLGTIAQMSGMIGAIGSIFAKSGPAYYAGAIVPAALIALLLFIGRYKLVERASIVMVVLFTFFTLAAVVALQWTSTPLTSANIAEGMSFQMPDSFILAFAAFGVTGMGAAELIFYPYWCLEKGYARFVGTRDDSKEWVARANGWMRVMRIDAWISMVIYTIGTVAFYLLGAAVFQGKGVDKANLMGELFTMYSNTLGDSGMVIYLAGAFMVLFSTVFVSTASNARLFADGANMLKLIPSALKGLATKAACVVIPVVIVAIALGAKAVSEESIIILVMIGAIGQAFMLPFLAIAAVYFRTKRIHPDLKPGTIWTIFLWISFLSITAVGGYQIWDKVAPLFGGE